MYLTLLHQHKQGVDKVEKGLKELGYTSQISDGTLTIKRKRKYTLIIIGTAFAIPVMWIGLSAHFTVFLFGLGLLLLPWILRGWRFPITARFVPNEGVELRYSVLGALHKVPFSDITELQLERTVKPSDVSPFMEGSDEYVYNFVLATANTRYMLLRVEYRTDDQEQIEDIRHFLLTYLRHLKSEG